MRGMSGVCIGRWLWAAVVASMLAACGGGGGNSGTTGATSTGGSTGTGTSTNAPSMTISLVNASDVEVSDHALSQTSPRYIKIVLKKANGSAVPYVSVGLALSSTQAKLVPAVSARLTDASGTLKIQVSPSGVDSNEAVTLTATAEVDGTDVTKTYSLQPSAGVISIVGGVVAVTPTTVQMGSSVTVSATVQVDGAIPLPNSVQVSFSSACGTVGPASALVNGAGVATAVVTTSSTGNPGKCSVSATAGTSTGTGEFVTTSVPITGIQFVSSSPSTIYQAGSVGANQSAVKFKVIDSLLQGVGGQKVKASLTNTDGGIQFCAVGITDERTSEPDGTVTFQVCAGTLPANLQVRASLADTPSIVTDSNLLTVQTGLGTQRFFDLAASKENFYVGGYFTDKFSGNTTTLTAFAADRQGNPVPNGTKVVFVAEGGQFNTGGESSCLITNGRCSVDLIGQDYRPLGSAGVGDTRPGRVTVLAYTDGEEYFIDKNQNNRYDAGELFEDLGNPYLDKNESNTFEAAYFNLQVTTNESENPFYPLPAGVAGTAACPNDANVRLSVSNTCNGVWDGSTKIRTSRVIIFSGGEIGGAYDDSIPLDKRTAILDDTIADGISIRIADRNGNPMPADAALSTSVIPSSSECKAEGFSNTYGNTTEPRVFPISLDKCVAGEKILFKVKVSSGAGDKETALAVTLK